MNIPIFKLCKQSLRISDLLLNSNGILKVFEFGTAPQGIDYPYMVWQVPTGSPAIYINELPDFDELTVQIDIYAETVSNANDIKAALRDVIEPHAHIITWRNNNFDSVTKRFRAGFDVRWFIER